MNQNKRKFFKLFGAGALGVTLATVTKPTELVKKIVAPNNNEGKTSTIEVKVHPQSVKRINKG